MKAVQNEKEAVPRMFKCMVCSTVLEQRDVAGHQCTAWTAECENEECFEVSLGGGVTSGLTEMEWKVWTNTLAPTRRKRDEDNAILAKVPGERESEVWHVKGDSKARKVALGRPVEDYRFLALPGEQSALKRLGGVVLEREWPGERWRVRRMGE